MGNYVLKAEPLQINFSRVSFRMTARDCLSCFEAYNPGGFSPVKYFLACRAVELALKALLLDLDEHTPRTFRKNPSHNLVKAYELLPPAHQILSSKERELLKRTSELNDSKVKAFEFIQPVHAVHAYSDFPDLEELYQLASKLVAYVEKHQQENP